MRGFARDLRQVADAKGMSRPSVANFDNIHAIPKSLLSDRIGLLSAHRHHEVKRALGYAFDWPELKTL